MQRGYRVFRTLGLRHLLVVNKRNQVLGIITRHDLVAVQYMNGAADGGGGDGGEHASQRQQQRNRERRRRSMDKGGNSSPTIDIRLDDSMDV